MTAATTSGRRPRSVVVVGAGLAGLLAARVLAEEVGPVILLDRDALPDDATPRGGAPQSAHAHGLLARGLRVIEQLFPGLTADMVARGVPSGDLLGDFRWCNDGQLCARGTSGLRGLLISRPLLEREVRRRLIDRPDVRVAEKTVVTGLLTDGTERVTGVRTVDRASGAPGDFSADLVVDASGRSSPAPRWLADLGYAVPVEERIEVDVAYSTRHYRREPEHLDGDLGVLIGALPDLSRSGVLLAQEGDRWTCTLAGYAGDRPPVDPAGFEAWAASLASPLLHRVIATAQPLDAPKRYRFPASVRRHYERLDRAPHGLLVTGDAICSFNPVYGQGMTVAASEALVLREVLHRWGGAPAAGDQPLAVRFWRACAATVDAPWQIASGGDLRFPYVPGVADRRTRLVNAYLPHVHRAAAVDPVVGTAFLRVVNLDAPPARLMSPALLRHVLRASRRGITATPPRDQDAAGEQDAAGQRQAPAPHPPVAGRAHAGSATSPVR